jgi:microcystin-dependent protein
MSFQQTSAPTGWTKDTTAAINDSMLRLVTGSVTTGGTTDFSTWNAQTATGATTLSTSQIPSHSHQLNAYGDEGVSFGQFRTGNPGLFQTSYSTVSTGSGGSHTHSLTQSLKYYDFIIASKD